MTLASSAALNECFGHDQRVVFSQGRGDLIKADLDFKGARVEVYLQGAHITRYRPRGDTDVLWMSDRAVYAPGGALRGGIPICWPWFGAVTDGSGRPQHGYARTHDFSVKSANADDDSTSLVLALDSEQAPWPDWRGRLDLEFEIRLSDCLWMEMRTRNQTSEPIVVTNALHSYFAISRRDRIRIPALTGLDYLDKTQDYRAFSQTDEIRIETEVDRVYQQPPAIIELHDDAWKTTTRIESWGNHNVVVWNPGPEKAAAMADFDDPGFENMICIEPANALDQGIELAPGEIQQLGQTLRTTGP